METLFLPTTSMGSGMVHHEGLRSARLCWAVIFAGELLFFRCAGDMENSFLFSFSICCKDWLPEAGMISHFNHANGQTSIHHCLFRIDDQQTF